MEGVFDVALSFLVSPIPSPELSRVLLALPAALVTVIGLPQVTVDKISVSAIEGLQTNITAVIHVQQGDVNTVRAIVAAVAASGFPLAIGNLVGVALPREGALFADGLGGFVYRPPSASPTPHPGRSGRPDTAVTAGVAVAVVAFVLASTVAALVMFKRRRGIGSWRAVLATAAKALASGGKGLPSTAPAPKAPAITTASVHGAPELHGDGQALPPGFMSNPLLGSAKSSFVAEKERRSDASTPSASPRGGAITRAASQATPSTNSSLSNHRQGGRQGPPIKLNIFSVDRHRIGSQPRTVSSSALQASLQAAAGSAPLQHVPGVVDDASQP